MKLLTPQQLTSFHSKIDYSGEGCWPWTASYGPNDYGQFSIALPSGKTRTFRVNRLALAVSLGRELVTGETANHACDNRACARVGEGHLYLGTQSQNMQDKAARGRAGYNRGEKSGKAVLSCAVIAEARRRYRPFDRKNGLRAIARDLNVSHPTLVQALAGNTYIDCP